MSSMITNDAIDRMYQTALGAGALGGKLMGAGGGGFLLLFVRPEDRQRVKQRLSSLVHVPLEFESHGSQIIFQNEEQEYLAEESARARAQPRLFQEASLVTGALAAA